MRYIILLLLFASCELPTYWGAPDDWHFDPPQEDTVITPIDTTVIDTLPTDSVIIDTCTELVEYTEPQFVTLYMKFDSPHDSVLWEGGGFQSYSLADIVTHITGLPSQIDTSPIGGSVLIKGTNNHAQFQLKIFARVDNAKWYMGTAKQALILPGSKAAYYKQAFHDYPSYDQFSFYGADVTCEEGIALSREPLKDCHAGRWYADLYFLPCQPPQSVKDSLDLYGWERVRANRTYSIDLRRQEGYDLVALASTGAQIVVCE